MPDRHVQIGPLSSFCTGSFCKVGGDLLKVCGLAKGRTGNPFALHKLTDARISKPLKGHLLVLVHIDPNKPKMKQPNIPILRFQSFFIFFSFYFSLKIDSIEHL
jgi:hypothetical protein